MKELQKQLKVSPKDMQALIRDLQMEASQENQQFSTFSSVMQMNVGSTSLVDRLIAPATTTMIAAAGGTGKTSLTYEVMEAITTGQPAFGEFETKQANVLVIQGDESMVNARKKWTRMDLAPDESRVKFLWDWNASRLKELEAEIVRDKRELVIFDSFGTLFCGWRVNFVNSPQKASDKLQVGELSLEHAPRMAAIGGKPNVIDV